MLKPTGYYVLVKMEKVTKVSKGGIIMYTENEHKREQGGHDMGTLVALGPTAFCGYAGIDLEGPNTAHDRAELWGVKIGDKIEFNKYDGKTPSHPDFKDYRLIQDAHIIGVIA